MITIEQRIIVPPRAAAAAARHPLLAGLMVAGVGCRSHDNGREPCISLGKPSAVLLYCNQGSGWCEVQGRRQSLRSGDLALLPPLLPHRYAAHPSQPGALYWALVTGKNLAHFTDLLGMTKASVVASIGDDWQIPRLFQEILLNLQRGQALPDLLLAAQTLGHLLALAAVQLGQPGNRSTGVSDKAAQAITYMSEHLDRPLKVREIAKLAGLSVPHFIESFKEQTGSTPHHYLHLLRMHRASQLLTASSLSLKEIAARLGYQDQFHFSRSFKAFSGRPPSALRAAGSGR